MLSHNKIKSSLGHHKVIIRIPMELGNQQMIALWGLVDSCLTGTIIHTSVLKCIDHDIEQGEEREWKLTGGIMQTSAWLKIKKAMLPSIMVNLRHIMTHTKLPYQIIFGQDVIQAIQINADVAKSVFRWQGIIKPMPKHGHWTIKKMAYFVKTIPSFLWSQFLLKRTTSCEKVRWVIRH